MAKVLIIDDEPDIRELLSLTLERMDLDVVSAEDVAGAFQKLSKEKFDLCFTDMRLPDGSGIEIIKRINKEYPNTPVAMITAYGNAEAAVQALKAGAFDFVSKPVDLHVLRELVKAAMRLKPVENSEQLTQKTSKNTEQLSTQSQTRLLGQSKMMAQVRSIIKKIARSQAPIFISGESGVGKELAAKLIHEQGPRSECPFIPVNCGAIPGELMESEFFGHMKGSFTGAGSDKKGLFQSADGGTLFLDEIADLPLSMQVKLLRAIQEKKIRPVGASQEVKVNVRILSATHKNLKELVESGQFRQDLYYRVNVIELQMPPLRERPEDIEELSDYLLTKITREWGAEKPVITADAMQKLKQYPFSGNVRELENTLERAVTMCEGIQITEQDLNLPGNSSSEGPEINPESVGLEEYISEIEKRAILKALKETQNNKTAAAKKLGITFRALRYKLQKIEKTDHTGHIDDLE
ncbi:MAG: sigma-54-dependent transcriptional regulator [bacterium]